MHVVIIYVQCRTDLQKHFYVHVAYLHDIHISTLTLQICILIYYYTGCGINMSLILKVNTKNSYNLSKIHLHKIKLSKQIHIYIYYLYVLCTQLYKFSSTSYTNYITFNLNDSLIIINTKFKSKYFHYFCDFMILSRYMNKSNLQVLPRASIFFEKI